MKEYKYKINGTKFNVVVGDVEDNKVHVEVNGTPYDVELDKAPAAKPTVIKPKAAAPAPRTADGEKVISKPAAAAPGGGTPVKSPLPGTIMSFNVSEGQSVNAGDTVCVLEAMK
ncbi:MAG: biotin/lipoyl-binding protein, partial [Muribaculaceae bacterium]|nr:biotin/lipoyl-binding protein [Muribaculaceae bacterium]